jgi:hypothetical protein
MSKLILDQRQTEEFLVEVITGKRLFTSSVDGEGEIFAVTFPSIEDRDRARIVYIQTCKRLEKMGLPTRGQMEDRIKEFDLLPRGHYNRKQALQSIIDANKKARDMTKSTSQKYELDLELEKLHQRLNKATRIEQSLFVNTVEVQAEEMRIDYYVSCCTLKGLEFNSRVWDTYDEFAQSTNKSFYEKARQTFILMNMGLDPSLIRALARTEQWRNRWKVAKKTGSQIFSGSSSAWDINKVTLCYWSDFYDTIYEYSNPPPEEVVQDDDALFEWIKEVNRRNKAGLKDESDVHEPGTTVTNVNQEYKIRPGAFVNQLGQSDN